MRERHSDRHSTPTYEQIGWKLKREMKYSAAISAFDKAIQRNQRRYYALHGKGECLIELQRYTEALDCFNQALSLNKRHPWAYHGVGRVYYGLQKYETALAYFDKSIDIEKRGILAWHWKGKTLIQMGKYTEAAEALQIALKNAIGATALKDETPSIEADLAFAKSKKTEKTDVNQPAQIIIQGNTAPVNIGGVQATDDAIINRASMQHEDDTPAPEPSTRESKGFFGKLFHREIQVCPHCGTVLKEKGMFCNHCGRRLQ